MAERYEPNPDQWGDAPRSAENSPSQRMEAFKDAAINRAGEALRHSVENGRAEQAGNIAIDMAAKQAERSLNLLPPGTRLVGKFIGKRLIARAADAGHEHLAPTLDRVSAHYDATPYASPDTSPWLKDPFDSYDAPTTPVPAEKRKFRDMLPHRSKEAPAATWSQDTTDDFGAPLSPRAEKYAPPTITTNPDDEW